MIAVLGHLSSKFKMYVGEIERANDMLCFWKSYFSIQMGHLSSKFKMYVGEIERANDMLCFWKSYFSIQNIINHVCSQFLDKPIH
jgi:hypothetical protein